MADVWLLYIVECGFSTMCSGYSSSCPGLLSLSSFIVVEGVFYDNRIRNSCGIDVACGTLTVL